MEKQIEKNREGSLSRKDYEKFKKSKGMSDSMPEILKIYERKYKEIYWDIDKGEITYK